ncbi:MAG: hypothetical protein K2G55_14750, partial [Lachnospiraceae bacterium]|nr:hypothetical protein [Lachnospiraceae bacterium]
FVRHKKDYHNVGKMTFRWGIVGALTLAIHLYFFPMCGAFLCGYILCSFLRERKIQWRQLLPGVSFSGVLLVSAYMLGGFSTRASAESDGLGECSFNLNGFFNEKGYSRFLDALPMYHESQYEGFAYLGIGIFVLMAFAAVLIMLELVRNHGRRIREHYIGIVIGILISIGLILFAASPVVTWNDKLLFILTDSSTLTHYWSIFRSSGRIIWPVCYLIYIVVIVCNEKLWGESIKNRNMSAMVSAGVLAVCCFLQVFDISGKLTEQRERFASEKTYLSVLQDDVWNELAQREELEHFVWVSNSYENRQILEMAKWAYDNMLTMNIFYFARGLSVIEDTQYSLQHPDDTYVFVFKQEELAEYLNCEFNFYEADGYVIGTTLELECERYK